MIMDTMKLRAILTYDMEMIMQKGMAVRMEGIPTVENLLSDYRELSPNEDGKQRFIDFIKMHLPKRLTRCLLYGNEEDAVIQAINAQKNAGIVNPEFQASAIYVLRLMTQMDEILKQSNDQEKLEYPKQIQPFLGFLDENAEKYFPMDIFAKKEVVSTCGNVIVSLIPVPVPAVFY